MNIRTQSSSAGSKPPRKETAARAWPLRRGILIVLGTVGCMVLPGCGRGNATAAPGAPRVVRVVEIDSSRHRTTETMFYTGVVRARTESHLGFRVGGKIAERLVNAGDTVKKGQPLLKLDPADHQLALESARAAVEAARALHTQTRLEQERVRTLVEKGAEARDALEKATAAAESRAAQLRAAEAQADQVGNLAGYTTLQADSDAVVMTALGEPGQVVSAGQTVIVLAKDGAREAAVDIPEAALGRIRHQAATARLYLNQAVTVPATLREVSGVADSVARTYEARYVLEGEPARFPLGATVTVRVALAGDSAQPATEIPLGSLIDRGDGAAVWIVDPRTSAIRKRPVSIARLGAETAFIRQGLQPGDVVVSLGAHLLNPGEIVRLEDPAAEESR